MSPKTASENDALLSAAAVVKEKTCTVLDASADGCW